MTIPQAIAIIVVTIICAVWTHLDMRHARNNQEK